VLKKQGLISDPMKLISAPLKKLSQSNQRFLIMLCLILGLLVIVPILNRFFAARIFMDTFLTAFVISMVYTINQKKGQIIAGIILATVMLASLWIQYLIPNNGILAIGMLVGVIFSVMVIANILGFIIKSEVVSREIIFAALLLYLLAAFMWAFLYAFLEIIDPASFNIDPNRPEGHFLIFQYYSFVTITTLGYGDITPVTEVAKAFSVLEAVIGQLYLVVAVAWLVGMHVSSKSR
jgi:hypothetical protein